MKRCVLIVFGTELDPKQKILKGYLGPSLFNHIFNEYPFMVDGD